MAVDRMADEGVASRASPGLAEKVAFLSQSSAYAHAPLRVETRETHMSFVFLAGERVYKLKKPVRYPFLDFSTLAARELNCREEVRLNRRLAPDIYLGVQPLTFSVKIGFAIGGEGLVVDWLVEMRRLPAERMLDRLISVDAMKPALIDALGAHLAQFYRNAVPSWIEPAVYSARFFHEQAINRDILARETFAIDRVRTRQILDRLDNCLMQNHTRLESRVIDGAVVDGHGDLRPEHICMDSPIAIFDCLEFSPMLRQVDPFDEVAFLGVECRFLNAASTGAAIERAFAVRMAQIPPAALSAFYGAWRAALRARLSLAHLLEPSPRQPGKWEPQAARYLEIAESLLDSAS